MSLKAPDIIYLAFKNGKFFLLIDSDAYMKLREQDVMVETMLFEEKTKIYKNIDPDSSPQSVPLSTFLTDSRYTMSDPIRVLLTRVAQ